MTASKKMGTSILQLQEKSILPTSSEFERGSQISDENHSPGQDLDFNLGKVTPAKQVADVHRRKGWGCKSSAREGLPWQGVYSGRSAD